MTKYLDIIDAHYPQNIMKRGKNEACNMRFCGIRSCSKHVTFYQASRLRPSSVFSVCVYVRSNYFFEWGTRKLFPFVLLFFLCPWIMYGVKGTLAQYIPINPKLKFFRRGRLKTLKQLRFSLFSFPVLFARSCDKYTFMFENIGFWFLFCFVCVSIISQTPIKLQIYV